MATVTKTQEKILLELPGIKRKKQDGTLYLSNTRIFWVDDASKEHKVNFHYSQIKTQRISPDTAAKVQLQLILHDGTSTNFHFCGEDAISDRTKAKELLQKLLPQFRAKPSADLEEKSRLLSRDPALHQLYKELVTGGIISAEEFWAQRADTIQAINISKEQKSGLPSAFLADVRAEIDSVNTVKFNLTVDAIEAIFRTYPTVKDKHDQLVPEEMTDQEFWTRFFQASHFHRNRTSNPASAVNLFTECMDKESGVLTSTMSGVVELADEEESSEGYGVGSSGPSGSISKDLVKRCNLHSSMVLKALNVEAPTKTNLREKVTMVDELGTEVATELPLLETTSLEHVGEDMKSSNAFKSTLREVLNWTPNLTQVITSECAESAIMKLTPGGEDSLVQNVVTNLQVPSAVHSALEKHYTTLNELLRHFWSCFPVTTSQAEEKVTRMAMAIQAYQISSDVVGTDHNLLTHLRTLRETALAKYQQWFDKRPKVGPSL